MKKEYNETEEIRQLEQLSAYRFLRKERIDEINALVCILEHVKTKARVLVIPSKDENKVFNIGFRTPSNNATGVAHIIEHTVLCGSKKFPAKDPFIELVKGSLNTFLNAMTYPDRTIYPVASVNDKDFQNLMEVYLDAVFYPNIYKEPKFFLQEGWRYHLDDADGELTYTGVVYNEMKGVYSSIDGILDDAITASLYEDSIYGKDSGGNPEEIPNLSYEEFLDFHRKYYHPSNSFVYLYGDMDMAKKLEWIDEAYLSHFDYLEVDSKIADVKRFDAPKEYVFDYPISETEDEEQATCFSLNVLTGGAFDPVRSKALDILGYVLIDKPGARLKQALLDAGIGEDVEFEFDDSIKEPSFSIVAKHANKDQKAEFLTVVKGILRKIANEGLNKEELYASINVNEFRAREADFGSYPRGLIYSMRILGAWIYDEDPTIFLKYESVFKGLREGVENGYFENLIREVFLDNRHEVMLTLNPVKGLLFQQDENLRKKLADIKAKMSREELDALVKQTKELRIFQETPSTKAEKEAIPLLDIKDIEREVAIPDYSVEEILLHGNPVKQIHVNEYTYGIHYVRLMFRIDWIAKEDLPWLSFYTSLLKKMDTEKYPYQQISTLCNLHLGGLAYTVDSNQSIEDENDFQIYFNIGFKSLFDKTDFAFDMAKEIGMHTVFTDKKRIREIVAEQRAIAKSQMAGYGHGIALARASSNLSKTGYFTDSTSGIRALRVLEDLYEHFDERIDDVIAKMQELQSRIFNIHNMTVCVTTANEGLPRFEHGLQRFSEGLNETKEPVCTWELDAEYVKNEAFATSSKVNYVGLVTDMKQDGFAYHGGLHILRNILNYDYLWNNIRVKGGAYGCSSQFFRTGIMGLSSYRDPNISNTLKVYEEMAEFVKCLELDDRELRQSIIGVISQMDVPKTPTMKSSIAATMYLQKRTKEDLQKERDEVLDADVTTIRGFYPMIEAALQNAYRVVVGNEVQIKEEAELFDHIESLFGE